MTYLPIIPMLLDKVTCLTSAPFLFLSLFISFFVYFLEQVGGGVGLDGDGGWCGGRGSALYILIFFSAKNDTHSPRC